MSRFFPLFFFVSILEGLAALTALLLIPSEGLSPARLALMGLILLPLAASLWLFVRSLDENWRFRNLEPSTRPGLFRALAILSSLLCLTSGLLLFLLRYLRPEATAPLFVRARPPLLYLLLLGAQTALWLTALRHGIHPSALRTRRGLFLSAAAGLGAFALVWLIVLFTGLGVTPDPSYWGEPGIPIFGWQFVLALLAGAFLIICQFPISRRADFLPLLIWLFAVLLWMSVPLTALRNSFYAPIWPPYNLPFPASDAAYYDANAQSLLMGEGFAASIPTRPLFILFLAALHALFGQDYARIILVQTLIYALLPAALYFLGKNMHSRAAGLAAALLAVFREWNSLWAASDARVSNTQMLLSDFPSALALIAWILLALRWLRRRSDTQSNLPAFLCGGALGLQLLLRTQAAFLAPGVLLLAFFAFWPDWKKWFVQSIVFTAGFILAVFPWLTRNYLATGSIAFEDPIQVKVLASMYSGGTPTSNFPQFEGQTPAEIGRRVMDIILEKPGYVAGFTANQFLANGIDTLLVLPIFARYDGLTAPIYLYWYEWNGRLSPANAALFMVYLAVISLGLAAAWKRLRWVGLLPLAAFISYAFATSLARYSGWRYIFPVDWAGYFYFALGAMEAVSLIALLFGREADDNADTKEAAAGPSAASRRPPLNAFLLSSFCILFIASLPAIAEFAIPRAEPLCAGSALECLSASGIEQGQAAQFLNQPGASMLTGRVLYPRYFPRFEGLASTNPAPAFAPREFPRMGFLLLDAGSIEQIVLPMKGSRPFPHAADAVVLGCRREAYVEARLVLFPASGEIFASGSLTGPCAP